MTRTGYAWDAAFLGHRTLTNHPEHWTRAEALRPEVVLADVPGLVQVKVDGALGLPGVQRVHDHAYVAQIRDAFARGQRTLDGGDTMIGADSFDVALRSASAALSMVGAVMRGELDNGFAAVRPPGHHALSNRARGFCLFNNVAAAARFAQRAHGAKRVLIVDWDVHPADGTMSLFYDDPDVHVLSVHQDAIFGPGVGAAEQRGTGPGEGATYNVPLAKGTGPGAYFAALEPALELAAARCRPDVVLISAGFDAHRGDPIGKLGLDDDTYGTLTRMVRRVARQHCGGRVVSVLEGGYQVEILRRCVRSHLEALLD
jgi:acetoin utilization deacetylase AcuC-like enzyme